jgi:HAD superfamily hydrolase (TIGR01509 family)
LFIFDCNGVLVDSEAIVAQVAASELTRVGFAVSPDIISRFFAGRRPVDMLLDIEAATQRTLPVDFAKTLANATLNRIKAELRPTAHVEHALTWLRGPKCVASSSPLDRVRISLESTGLIRFFEPHLFSANEVPSGKPAPDLFLMSAERIGVAPEEVIVLEDSPLGVEAATNAGMRVIAVLGHPEREATFSVQPTVLVQNLFEAADWLGLPPAANRAGNEAIQNSQLAGNV